MIVPERRVAVSRTIHISAPHPGFDIGTPSQAAYFFKATGAKSFLMAGRTRKAFLHPSPCISTTSQSGYYDTDPAYKNIKYFSQQESATLQHPNLDSNDRPVKRLKGHLQLIFPTWSVSLPPDSSCILTATRNVVRRYINGVPEDSVCHTDADPTEVLGEFVHIEQYYLSRGVESYEMWAGAIRRTFETTCAEGR
ncbi:hypothetical protein K443DRAFT_7930 [Laccaria amethystina LaAM-08-1]|uniref:Uncharacterized protein n=1 Tax=Laccaria amethystina LaAM-08-1 TaxID=1095629 RepID=A0A0C9X4Z9_9AGAR|nr:hypothetical protein K443DRAFT_7930 [Laccaria amethystina LaAM-08-1]